MLITDQRTGKHQETTPGNHKKNDLCCILGGLELRRGDSGIQNNYADTKHGTGHGQTHTDIITCQDNRKEKEIQKGNIVGSNIGDERSSNYADQNKNLFKISAQKLSRFYQTAPRLFIHAPLCTRHNNRAFHENIKTRYTCQSKQKNSACSTQS